jgi:flagellar biosynthesis protein FlhB
MFLPAFNYLQSYYKKIISFYQHLQKHEKKRILSSHRYSYMFMVIALAFMLSYLPQFILLFVGIGDTMFWVNRTKIELSLFSSFNYLQSYYKK